MKIFLSVKYSKLPENVPTAEALSRLLITEAMAKRFPQGMPRTESRMYAKILDQIYEEKNYIEVEEQAFLLIKETLDQAQLPANFSSWKWALLDHLDNCAEKKKDG